MISQPSQQPIRGGIRGWKVVLFLFLAGLLFAVALLIWGIRVRDHFRSQSNASIDRMERQQA